MSHQVGADCAVSRRIRGPVLRLRRDAPDASVALDRPEVATSAAVVVGKGAFAPGARSAEGARPHRLAVAAGLAQIGEFSFILGQAVLAGSSPPSTTRCPCRRARVHHPQPVRVPPDRSRRAPAATSRARRTESGGGSNRRERRFARTWSWSDAGASATTSSTCWTGWASRARDRPRRRAHRGVAARGIPALFGDAANSEILRHAGLGGAGPRRDGRRRPDGLVVVAGARQLAPELWMIARSSHRPASGCSTTRSTRRDPSRARGRTRGRAPHALPSRLPPARRAALRRRRTARRYDSALTGRASTARCASSKTRWAASRSPGSPCRRAVWWPGRWRPRTSAPARGAASWRFSATGSWCRTLPRTRHSRRETASR